MKRQASVEWEELTTWVGQRDLVHVTCPANADNADPGDFLSKVRNSGVSFQVDSQASKSENADKLSSTGLTGMETP